MKFILSLTITLFLISSCNPYTDKQTDKNSAFKAFLKKFKPVKLPYFYNQNDKDKTETIPLDLKSSDTLFIKPDNDYIQCYGLLPDTSSYYALIAIYPADAANPVLFTFSKNGKFISRQDLNIEECGSGPDIIYCNSTGTINKNLDIFSSDSIESQRVDSAMNPIDSIVNYVNFRKGHITKSGKIIMSKDQQIVLKHNIK